jgi:hypothetical protein
MSSKDLMKGALVGAIASSIVMISASALAGTGIGGVFNLGKTNKVNAPTTLTGKVKGNSLQLTNTGSGPALGITVRAGKAPLVVSAKAGKAINLNADELDGHDSSFFASKGFSTGFTDSNPVTLTSAGENHTLMTLPVPAGHYIVITRLQGITGGDGGGNDFRYDCVLAGPAATIDDPIYRVGETNGQENYLTYQGAYSGAGPITLTCRSANVHTLTALSGSMVAIKVGS